MHHRCKRTNLVVVCHSWTLSDNVEKYNFDLSLMFLKKKTKVTVSEVLTMEVNRASSFKKCKAEI